MYNDTNTPALCRCPRCGLIDDQTNFLPVQTHPNPGTRDCGGY